MGVVALSTMQDLFREGDVASVEAPDGSMVTVWVNKLSSFEKDDADRFARAARARRVLAWDASEDEQAIFELETGSYSDADIVDALAKQQEGRFYFEALNEVRADEAWKERLEYLGHAEVLESGGPDASAEDQELLNKTSQEYLEAVNALQAQKVKEYGEDIAGDGRVKLMQEYRKAWRDAAGMSSFYDERRIAEIYFSARVCTAVNKGDGVWDHKVGKCNHVVRLLSNRAEVRDLPDVVLGAIVDSIQRLSITPEQAGNSDAPTASSASPEPQNAVEDSTPSGPTETSAEPVGT